MSVLSWPLARASTSSDAGRWPRRTGALLGGAAALVVALASSNARADVSSWFFVGGGPTAVQRGNDLELRPSLLLETGMGSPPSGRMALGGVLKVQPIFGHSVDLGLAFRAATRGYVNGGWGVAMDLGGYQRFIRPSMGLTESLVIGAPWGLALSVGAGAGTEDQRHLSFALGFDLARLTVYRTTGGRWWKNEFPAYRPREAR